jgi:AcrR family transcriptional regulator
MSTVTPSPRDRLLATADRLFYEEGIHTVGIDRIIEEAGVAKASLYACFGSKEGLVLAYLRARLEARQARITRHLATLDAPRAQILGVFDALATYFVEPNFHGCAFMNAGADSPSGSAVAGAVAESRAWTAALFFDLARQAGITDPDDVARQLVQIYDGAMTSAHLDRDPDAAATAKRSATTVIDAASTRRRRPGTKRT